MPEIGFSIFWIFCYFIWNFLAWVKNERKSGIKFFSLFLSLSHPILAQNNAGKWFLIFWIFLLFFFLEFSCSGRVGTEFGTKFFFLSFSAYLIPFRLKIMLERSFLVFRTFAIFFGIFFPGSSMNGIWD